MRRDVGSSIDIPDRACNTVRRQQTQGSRLTLYLSGSCRTPVRCWVPSCHAVSTAAAIQTWAECQCELIRQARHSALPRAVQHITCESRHPSPADADQLWLVSNAFATGLQQRRSLGRPASWQDLATRLRPVKVLSYISLTYSCVYGQICKPQMPLHMGNARKPVACCHCKLQPGNIDIDGMADGTLGRTTLCSFVC